VANKLELLNRLKRNPDNTFTVDLLTYLNFRLEVIKCQCLKSGDDGETKILQGRGREIDDLIVALTRKPIAAQPNGAFN
jgi:hypothetical protein